MTWKPGLASEQKEAEMEALNLPEEERDEVRRPRCETGVHPRLQ